MNIFFTDYYLADINKPVPQLGKDYVWDKSKLTGDPIAIKLDNVLIDMDWGLVNAMRYSGSSAEDVNKVIKLILEKKTPEIKSSLTKNINPKDIYKHAPVYTPAYDFITYLRDCGYPYFIVSRDMRNITLNPVSTHFGDEFKTRFIDYEDLGKVPEVTFISDLPEEFPYVLYLRNYNVNCIDDFFKRTLSFYS